MASHSSDKVVPLDARARARPNLPAQESARVVADCRELALDRIARALSGVFDRVEDELFGLAEQSGDRESQNLFLEARTQARERRAAIEAAFRRHFVLLFDRRLGGEAGDARAGEGSKPLALVDEEELEQVLAAQAMTTRLRVACEAELGALSQRFGFLLERPDLAEGDNPLSPETVCGALRGACDQIEAGWKVRLTLFRALEGPIAADLLRLYRDLNAHLVERRILPDIKPSIRRIEPSPARETGTPAAAAPGAYAALAQLLGAAGPLASPAANASAATRGFVQALTGLQQPGAPESAGDFANVIRALKSSPQSAALAGVDAMTIDLVAMLFDFIFEDRHIRVSAKALLGRLQIPTLKVALLDRTFFSSRAHPARQLLDRLAHAAIGLDESSESGSAVFAKLEEVVGRVLHEFDDDIALLSELSAQMQEFLKRQDEAEEALARTTSRLVEERDRHAIARALAEEEVGRRLAGCPRVPEAVRAMLEDAWVRSLAVTHVEHGEQSAPWKAMLATADELLWSVEPKPRPEDRRRLVAGIPALVRSLQEGLARAGIDQAARERFLGSLVDCHAEAVKAGLKGATGGTKARAQEPAPEAAPAAPALERERLPAGDVVVEEIRLGGPRGQPQARKVFTRTGIWTHVRLHTWVEFLREGTVPLRARLTWISPARGVYLFTNSTASAAISVTPEALAEQMRQGEARLLDDSPLVDRAVDSMLASLRERAA